MSNNMACQAYHDKKHETGQKKGPLVAGVENPGFGAPWPASPESPAAAWRIAFSPDGKDSCS
jgi:hypothetical protein